MNLVPKAVTQKAAIAVLKARHHSPTLLFGAGLASMTASTVLACRATLHLEEVMAKTETDQQVAHQLRDDRPDSYSAEEYASDLNTIRVKGIVAIGKLYAPSVLIGFAGVACLTKSHHILKERNFALTAAYTAMHEAFEQYRANVREKYGEDEDRKLRFAHEEYTVVDDDTGREVTKIRANIDEQPSGYAKFFDEYSTCWTKEPEYNYTWIRGQQNIANEMLQVKGFVLLNEVYKSLGLLPTEAGAVVGWILDPDNPENNTGDGWIDFGLSRNDPIVHDFINGRENAILLDFNVDGVITHKIEQLSAKKRGMTTWQS